MDYRNGEAPWWKTRSGIVLFGFAAVAAFFLFTGHRAHVFGLLPYLLLLACPLMHLFMHHGHGGHDHRGVNDPSRNSVGPQLGRQGKSAMNNDTVPGRSDTRLIPPALRSGSP